MADRLTAQTILTKDSSLPEEYVSLIRNSQWSQIGIWKSNKGEIFSPDTIKTVRFIPLLDPMRSIQYFHGGSYVLKDTLSPFEMNIYYFEVKGRKLITGLENTSEKTFYDKILYVDNSTLILETKSQKDICRMLYRRHT